jgi:hypothetical protein
VNDPCRTINAVDAEIDLGPEGGAFSLAARLYVSLPGMERATAQRLVEAARQVCPIREQRTAGLGPLRGEQTVTGAKVRIVPNQRKSFCWYHSLPI